jgi:hypothetical protein
VTRRPTIAAGGRASQLVVRARVRVAEGRRAFA